MKKLCIDQNTIIIGDLSLTISAAEDECGCINIKVCCNTQKPPVTKPPVTCPPTTETASHRTASHRTTSHRTTSDTELSRIIKHWLSDAGPAYITPAALKETDVGAVKVVF